MAEHVTIRCPVRSELSAVMQLTDKEGWNLELSYLEAGFDMDPTGWRVAVSETGEIIGMCRPT